MSTKTSVRRAGAADPDHRPRLEVERFASNTRDAAGVVAEMQAAFSKGARKPDGVLVFCSPRYDLPDLGRALAGSFGCTVAGCTTAGQIGPLGFQVGGLTAAALYSPDLSLRSYLIEPLTRGEPCAKAAATRARADLGDKDNGFGMLLIDGLSNAEEGVAAAIQKALRLPVVGGSAGDDLRFDKTFVYYGGQFLTGIATLTVFETSLSFETLKFQHLLSSDLRLVVTDARPEQRRVLELNGESAAETYAEWIGVDVPALDASVFAGHPLLMRRGDDAYVRSIKEAHPDGSLSFYCAVDVGEVLSLGREICATTNASDALELATWSVPEPKLVIGFDCILRRLELERNGTLAKMGNLFADNQVVGFSTYGEQYHGLHVNQTFTGVVLGD